jgi:hypothetical protein
MELVKSGEMNEENRGTGIFVTCTYTIFRRERRGGQGRINSIVLLKIYG